MNHQTDALLIILLFLILISILLLLKKYWTNKNSSIQTRFMERISLAYPDILFVFDEINQKFIYTNRSVIKLLGYAGSEVTINNLKEFLNQNLHPEDAPELEKIIAQINELPDDKVFEFEYRLKHKEGHYLAVYNRVVIFERTPNGEVAKILGSISDLTQIRKNESKVIDLLRSSQQMNEDLLLQEEELRSNLEKTVQLNEQLLESEKSIKEAQRITKLGSWEWNVVTGEVKWSDQFYRNYGYEPGEISPTYDFFLTLIHPEDIEQELKNINIILTTQKPASNEFRIIRKDGQVRNVITHAEVKEDSKGNIIKMYGTVQDITERKIAEENIRKLFMESRKLNEELTTSEELLRNKLNEILILNDQLEDKEKRLSEAQRIAGLGIWEHDLADDKMSWTEEIFRLFGMHPGDPIPGMKDFLLKIHPEDREKLFKAMTEIENGKSFQFEIRHIHPDGKILWVSSVGNPVIGADGKVRKVVGIALDIDQRKRSEEKLKQQNIDLTKTNSELDAFVYRASHDLRAPLTSILGLISLTKDVQDDALKQNYLYMMEKSIQKLDTFIRNIIDHSRNSRIEISNRAIDFQKLTEEVIDELKFMEGSDKIAKTISVTSDANFYSDPFRLKIIFTNIISNAIRYKNERVNSFISIVVKIDPCQAFIEFKDNGWGIRQESIDKIFDMFYRASETQGGSGLGLYIVKEVLQALNGSIKLESTLGEGTTFMITIPNNQSSIEALDVNEKEISNAF